MAENMNIGEAREAFLALETDLEEARTALLVLPGVCKVDVSMRISDPVTQAEFKVYYVDANLSHEEVEQAVEGVKEVGDALVQRLGCRVEIMGVARCD